jgi:oligopeptide transport system ATP-binding protein
MSEPILQLSDVKTHFPISHGFIFKRHVGTVKAVDGVTLSVGRGEVLGLVGESGCGKSTLARTIMQLVPTTAGTVVLEGKNITGSSTAEVAAARRHMQMVFQDPYASLNPRMTVFDTLAEPLRFHGVCPPKDIPARVAALMKLVGLAPRFMQKYPHEFSGGQRQRIAIARALALEPRIIIADEPVSALDVSIQAQVINLLMDLQRQLGLAYLFISHDLSVVRHISHRIGVMYLGRIVELATADALHLNPRHPYTQALLSAAPIPDPILQRERRRIILQGEVPSADRVYPGCPFADRCPIAEGRCREIVPRLEGNQHLVACIKAPPEIS